MNGVHLQAPGSNLQLRNHSALPPLPMHLLFIEDDDLMGRAATQAFPTRGLSVTWVRDSIAARAAMEAEQFDLILLDLSLPGISGQEFLQRLRESGDQIPVVVVTARSEVSDRIRILDLGADDYVVKPFDLDEFAARLRAVARRAAAGTAAPVVHELGALLLYPTSRVVQWNGQEIELSAREFAILELLLLRRPRALSRRHLEEAIYGSTFAIEGNAVEVHVHNLRKKLSRTLILTVRGQGYALNCDEALSVARNSDQA